MDQLPTVRKSEAPRKSQRETTFTLSIQHVVTIVPFSSACAAQITSLSVQDSPFIPFRSYHLNWPQRATSARQAIFVSEQAHPLDYSIAFDWHLLSVHPPPIHLIHSFIDPSRICISESRPLPTKLSRVLGYLPKSR